MLSVDKYVNVITENTGKINFLLHQKISVLLCIAMELNKTFYQVMVISSHLPEIFVNAI